MLSTFHFFSNFIPTTRPWDGAPTTFLVVRQLRCGWLYHWSGLWLPLWAEIFYILPQWGLLGKRSPGIMLTVSAPSCTMGQPHRTHGSRWKFRFCFWRVTSSVPHAPWNTIQFTVFFFFFVHVHSLPCFLVFQTSASSPPWPDCPASSFPKPSFGPKQCLPGQCSRIEVVLNLANRIWKMLPMAPKQKQNST